MKTKIELSNGQIVKLSQKELDVLENNCKKILGEVQQMNDWVSAGVRITYSEAALETFAQASVEKDEAKKKNLINKLFEKWSVDQLEKYSITNFEYFSIGQNGKIQHRYEDLLETSKEMISTGKLTKPDAEKLTYSLESLEYDRQQMVDMLHNIKNIAATYFEKKEEAKEESSVKRPEESWTK